MKLNGSLNNVKSKSDDRREAVIDVFGEDSSYNSFYDSVSIAFRILSFMLIAAFLLFIVTSAFNNADEFSYDNLEYIVRNFALTLDENKDETVYSIRYNPDSSRTYSLFGKGLSVSGNSGILIYSATGRRTCSENFDYKDPVMVSSEKYALVYDNNDERYSLYNSFTKVYSSELQYPIRGASVSDNGYYALITSSDEFQSTVEVYDDSFSIVNRLNMVGYVIDVDIDDTKVLVATVEPDTQTNNFAFGLLLCKIGATEPWAESQIVGSFPLSCFIREDGYTAVCSDSILFFDKNGKEIASYQYNGRELSNFDVDGDNVFLLFKDAGFEVGYNTVCIDSEGEEVFVYDIDSTVFDIELCGRRGFVLTESAVIAINDRVIYTDFIGADHNSKLLAYSDNAVYVCTDTSAPLIVFDE